MQNPQSSRAPITLQQLNQPPLYSNSSVLQSLAVKNRPPGLISINQRAPAPSAVRPQMPSQKIKFPITKHWRPNLIPIEPSKKNEKKPGLVQVSLFFLRYGFEVIRPVNVGGFGSFISVCRLQFEEFFA